MKNLKFTFAIFAIATVLFTSCTETSLTEYEENEVFQTGQDEVGDPDDDSQQETGGE